MRELQTARSGIAVVFSVTGPLYERTMPMLPQADEPHQIPSGYWKMLRRARAT